jgi:hypothetical protein
VADDSAKRSVSLGRMDPAAARAIETSRGVVVALRMAPMRLLCGPHGEPI